VISVRFYWPLRMPHQDTCTEVERERRPYHGHPRLSEPSVKSEQGSLRAVYDTHACLGLGSSGE